MKILFIKLKHIGDALLLTPTIAATKEKFPQAQIWVWVRKGTEDILNGCDGINRVLTTSSPDSENKDESTWRHDWKNLRDVRQERFDYVFELSESGRGRWLALASGSPFLAISSTDSIPQGWKFFFKIFKPLNECGSHRVVKDYRLAQEVLNLPDEIPALQFSKSLADFNFVKKHQLQDCIVIHPCTRWKRKSWPLEKWVALGRKLHESGHRLLLSSGPAPEEISFCQEIALQSGINPCLTNGALSWKELAGVLFSAKLFIGVDTAAMHLAAACQTPQVALFGPSVESAWHPWSSTHIIVVPEVSDDEIRREDGWVDVRLRKMDRIQVSQVLEACNEILQKKKNL